MILLSNSCLDAIVYVLEEPAHEAHEAPGCERYFQIVKMPTRIDGVDLMTRNTYDWLLLHSEQEDLTVEEKKEIARKEIQLGAGEAEVRCSGGVMVWLEVFNSYQFRFLTALVQ